MAKFKLLLIWFTLNTLVSISLSGCQISQLNTTLQDKDRGDYNPKNENQPFYTNTTEEEDIALALQQAISKHDEVLPFLINKVSIDHIKFSEDRALALVWLSLSDLESGEIIPGEPGLAIASRQSDETGNDHWEITLQVDPTWANVLSQIPESLLNAETKARYMPKIQATPKDHQIYTGYRLPWENDRAVRVSGSIGHVFTYKSCPSTCLYAFDFADGTMFPVVAAKGGIVKYAVWNWPNGNTEHANYLVLEDNSTSPTTYQVYFHLAQGSIPEKFRVKGAEVLQGEFIGLADDTGYSTSHHLHFHVHTNTNSYWGTSVDIVFDEVKINGGRPRTCTEAANYPEYGTQCQSGNWFVSENGDRERPTGSITQPLPLEKFSVPNITVRGTGSDDSGISYIQLMATSNGEWKPIGPLLNKSPFTTQINLCDAGIPNGTFFLSLQLMDTTGKLSEGFPSLLQLEKNYSCPNDPPVCVPNENQVALYTEPDFHGSCALFEVGEYKKLNDFNNIGNNNADSIQVGANVLALLYSDGTYSGNEETFLNSDPDLSDNKIGINMVSSLVVSLRPDIPTPPTLLPPGSSSASQLVENTPVTLSWITEDKNTTMRSELLGPDGWHKALDWQTNNLWDVGELPAGEFVWTVWSRNISGESQSTHNFIVHKKDLPSVTEMLPNNQIIQSTAIKLQWEVLEGEEDLAYFDIQMRKDGSPWMDWKTAVDAGAREAWFVGAPGSTYAFRMRSVDYAGNLESFPEKAEIKVSMSLKCSADEFEKQELSDNNWIGATQMELNQPQIHNLCDQQDVDWINFSAQNSSTYQVVLKPISDGTSLKVKLFNANHDIVLAEAETTDFNGSAEIEWTAPDTGLFYLQITGADPNLFGTDTQYQIEINRLAQMQPNVYFCSTILLPIIWGISKSFSRHKSRSDLID